LVFCQLSEKWMFDIFLGRKLGSRWIFWKIHMGQMLYTSRADAISSMPADYHPLWLIMIPSGWVSSPMVDCNFKKHSSLIIDDIRLSWMNIVPIGWISSAIDEYRPRQRVSSALVEYRLLEMNIMQHSW
jgi:hypothetical protein